MQGAAVTARRAPLPAGDEPAVLRIPANEAAERAVLGAVLCDPSCYPRAAAAVDAADFYNEANGRIFDAFRALVETGAEPDPVTLPAQLERDGALERVGGASYVASLVTELPDTANVEHYAALVRAAARKRHFLRLGQDVIAAVASENGKSEAALAAVKAELAAALAEDAPPAAPAFGDAWRQADIGELTSPPRRRQWLLTLPETQGGHGLLPRGKVGIMAAEGGTGKTTALVALAVSVITARPWLGLYQVPPTVTGRVLLLLAEEDSDDVHRRLWKIAEALRLTGSERTLLAERLVVIPLAGRPVALTAVSGGGLVETPLAAALRNRLMRDAGEDGFALIGLDPLSRFAGGDVEGSNEAATRYVEVLESLAAAPGHPTVLVSAHSSKVARRQGQADVRGVTGLSDAARWVATLRRDGEEVRFAVAKSNYSLPCPPARLRWRDETLEVVSGAEILDAAAAARAAAGAELDDDVRRVVDVLTREGAMTSRDTIAHAAGLRLARGRAAIDLAIARGMVAQVGTDRRRTYSLAPGDVAHTSPPHPPHPSGTDGRLGACPSRTDRDGRGTAGRMDGSGRIGTDGRTADDPGGPK
ncbi:MAG: hypothetical protein EPN53_16755 [Acidobacteria bacterium]|nr:MAG: hypothetical protein EPN53_16755 [Acidobacteriota bacterium]